MDIILKIINRVMNECPFFVSFQNAPAWYLNKQTKILSEYTLCCEYTFDSND